MSKVHFEHQVLVTERSVIEVLPCPFCGTELQGKELTEQVKNISSNGERSIHCPKCWAKGPSLLTVSSNFREKLEQAVLQWNGRKP